MWGQRVRAQPIAGEAPDHNLIVTALKGQFNREEWESDTDWQKGIYWRPTSCIQAYPWDPNCDADATPKPDPPDPQPVYQVDPFVVNTVIGCTLVANGQGKVIAEAKANVLEQLDLSTPWSVEYQFWTGSLGSRMQSLDSTSSEITGLTSAATVITGTFDRQVALAKISQSLAGLPGGRKGTIHAPSWVTELWNGDGLIEDRDGVLYTKGRGDRVVAGSGYPGTGPNGSTVTALQAWVFATGPVEVYLEEIGPKHLITENVTEAFDRTTNYYEWRAERMALVRWDPCAHFAILINDVSSNSGGGG